jgi:phenylacetate-CoA ligase
MPFTDRFPLLTDSGARLLRKLEDHPCAPRYTHPGVNRLTRAGLERAREFAVELQSLPSWQPGQVPAWLVEFVEHCYREVPLYRRDGPAPRNFFDIPTTDRADLHREPWAFVPDSQPLDNLVVYNTSGTTGHPLDILTHADTLAFYIPLLRAALARYNISLDGGPDRVALALVCYQKRTYTYAAVTPLLADAGFVKVNLNPAEWRAPADRAEFLDDYAPEIYTGDPLAFNELAQLPIANSPKALVSTAMTLTSGLKRALEQRFACPVIDVYSLNESGPLGVADLDGSAYLLLQPRLYVEILDPDGAPCPPGVRGEIILSGGFNPFLPLLRYRTGDYAALEWRGSQPTLTQLAGRPPVIFRATDGRFINNIDIAIALRPLPLAQYTLHQSANGSLTLRVHGADPLDAIRAAVLELFGADQRLSLEALDPFTPPAGKLVQFTSALSIEEGH